jgi:CRP-like cAMP-binding protein
MTTVPDQQSLHPASGRQTTVKSKRDFLRSVTLFERLPNPALDRLVLAFERHKYTDLEVVFHQGESGDRLYLVETGNVDLFHADGRGTVRKLATVGMGGYFGELALLSDKPRAATALVIGEVELLSISGRELKRLLAESAPALRSMIGAVGAYEPPDSPLNLWKRLTAR